MFSTYIKTAWRNIVKSKFYSFINIIGLTIGMASAMLIGLWIQNELSHDRFYEKADRIYMAHNRDKVNGEVFAWNTTPKPLGLTIKKDYPEVEDVVRLNEYAANFLLTAGDKRFSLHGEFADSGFLKMFSLPLLQGNAATSLSAVNSIVLTKQLAIKLFGNQNAIGKTVLIDSADNFTVTGVLADLPPNSRFNFEYVLPWAYATKKGLDDDIWGNNGIATYVLLKAGADHAIFDAKIKNITINHSKYAADRATTQVFTRPIKDTWLYDRQENGAYTGGRIERVKMFTAIAALILIIACINFMNLSTARSEKRGKEVGIRKVVGAQKKSLVAQFIAESIILAAIAGILSVLVVQLALPAYDELVGVKLFINFQDVNYWLFAAAFIVFTGLLAGLYPAFYLSSLQPIKVLKGTFKLSGSVVTPRKILVVLQFTFAITLIICTIIVTEQIKYAQSRDAGYSRSNLAFIIEFGDAHKNYELIRRGLLESGAATAVAQTSAPMTESWADSWGFTWQGSTPADMKTDFNMFSADDDFAKTMNIKVIRGRGLDINTYRTDSTACLLNEAAVKAMCFKDPIGQTIKSGNDQVHVIGVIKDFILGTPYEPVKPMIVCGPVFSGDIINFKINPEPTISASLKKAEAVFKQYNPQYPFNIRYYDSEYNMKFREEQQTATLAGLFAGLTILISCLGLLGLATFVAEARIKEIGVRKVLGASVQRIVALLSKDFLKLVFISFLIASPVAWLVMHSWLSSYSYRVGISLWVFVTAGVLSAAIAFITVSFQAIKAALANPVKSLRSE